MKTKLLFFSLLMLALGGSLFAQRPLTIVGGVVTANVADTNAFQVILTANVTGVTLVSTVGTSINNAVTPDTGYQITMRFVQDATGSRTVAFGGNITSSCAINATALSVTVCRWQYTANGNTWADAGGSSSSSSPSSAYTFSVSAGTVTATPNATGLSTFTGTDMGVVFNQVTSALATVGGKLFFRNGVYNINSLTNDATTGCSNFDGSAKQISYALGFPANTVATSVQWLLEGESAPVWQGEAGSVAVNNSGVIFKVTSTAVSSVTAGNILAGFWQKPVTNCTLNASNGSNDIHFKNMGLRFPVNTRGNEIAFAPYFVENIEYENVVADFDVAYNTIATGSAPTKGTYQAIGIATPVSSSGNYQYFRNTFATGYDLCYDMQTEHIVGETMTAIYCNAAGEFGRSGTGIFHPIKIIHFVDQENKAGLIFGPQMLQGSRVDLDLDFEFGVANWYARTTAAMTETNCGYSTGAIWYQAVVQASGIVAEIPALSLFNSCGGGFQEFEGTGNPNIALIPATDTATRPNATTWGPAWVGFATATVPAACSNLVEGANITSNAFTATASAGCYYAAQPFNLSQFAQVTVATVTATTAVRVTLLTGTGTSQARYEYECSTSGGAPLKRTINAVNAAGAVTATIATAANSGCTNAANDIIRLENIRTDDAVNHLYAYYCPAGVCGGTPDLTLNDSSLSTGAPGLVLGGASTSATNFVGGNMPTRNGVDTLFARPIYAPTYQTLTNCLSATCGSAAAGSVFITNPGTAVTVTTTAVTANSQIMLTFDSSLGTRLGVTCTATNAGYTVTARTPGTSFVITGTPAANSACLNWTIVN